MAVIETLFFSSGPPPADSRREEFGTIYRPRLIKVPFQLTTLARDSEQASFWLWSQRGSQWVIAQELSFPLIRQSTCSFADFISQHWTPVVLPTLKYATQKHYRYILGVHLLPTFGNTPLADIRPEGIQSLLAVKLNSGLAWKTVKHIRGVLTRTLATAEERGYLSHNPALKTKLPRPPSRPISKVILTPSQVARLRDHLLEPARSIVTLVTHTGLRIGEILALRWKCVDLAGRTLRVSETLYDGHFDAPKSQVDVRIIPLGEGARATLAGLCPGQALPDDLVFHSRTGRPLSRHNLLRRQLQRVARTLGIPEITWHSLRQCHAMKANATASPRGTVQPLRKDSTSQGAQEVYLQARPNNRRGSRVKTEARIYGTQRTHPAGASQPRA